MESTQIEQNKKPTDKVVKDRVGNIIEYIKYYDYFSEKNINYVHINFASVNYNKLESFFKLLKILLKHLKSEKITTIRMNVVDNDWNNILKNKTSWKITNTVNYSGMSIHIVECDIGKCLKNMLIGFNKE